MEIKTDEEWPNSLNAICGDYEVCWDGGGGQVDSTSALCSLSVKKNKRSVWKLDSLGRSLTDLLSKFTALMSNDQI